MLCQNTACGKKIDDDSTFCYFCGNSQTIEQPTFIKQKPTGNLKPTVSSPLPKTIIFGQSQPIPNPTTAGVTDSQNYRFIEFRASDNVWNFTESEPPMPPEQRRPVLILDEQTILLSETNKHLSSDELLARVQSIIQAKQVPVESYIAQARWLNDYYEIRPRIIAELKDHAYSGLKMILALDYMGNWASLQFQIGMQPDPIPKPPPSVSSGDQTPLLMILGGIIGGFIGLLMLAAGSGGVSALGFLLLVGGIALTIYGFIQLNEMNQNIDLQRKERDKYEREQYQRSLYKARMELFRTFKIDDARLFREAMDGVFKQVVDDIIEQGGGKIVREIKGGENELFDFQKPVQQQGNPQQTAHPSQSVGSMAKTAATTVAKNKVKKELGLDI